MSTLCLPDITTRDQAFPLHICIYCKQSNTAGENVLGTNLSLSLIIQKQILLSLEIKNYSHYKIYST